VQDMVWVYSIKRTGVLKCRAASDGVTLPRYFDPDDLYSEGLSVAVTRLLAAFGAHFQMIDSTTDVKQCFAQLNTWISLNTHASFAISATSHRQEKSVGWESHK
jgi:hypothetical protein